MSISSSNRPYRHPPYGHTDLQPAVVVVFEIAGARALWRHGPEAMAEAMGAVERAVDSLLAERHGERIATDQAELVGRFGTAVDAIEWAIAMHEALVDIDWPVSRVEQPRASHEVVDGVARFSGLRFSAGVDIGVLRPQLTWLGGRTLVRGAPIGAAARLAAGAPSGAVALNPAVVDSLAESNAKNARRLFERIHECRGVSTIFVERLESLELVERIELSNGRQHRTDQYRTDPLAAARHNLPQFQGAFFGRASSFSALVDALDAGERRITIWGPTGVGKSRLVVEFARQWLARNDDLWAQAWFCDLVGAASPREALFAIARATGVQIPRSEDLDELGQRLESAFSARGPLLLILDGVEQLDARLDPSIRRWIGGVPNLVVLTTTQYRPDEGRPDEVPAAVGVGALGRFTAEALFEDRLIHAPRRSAAPDDARRIGSVVDRCGGIPLVLELLANSARSGSIERLFDREYALSGERPPDELEEALQRSLGLLSSTERTALAACTVFATSFSAEAAVAVLDSVLDDGGAALASLQKASLVRAYGRGERPERLVLLGPVAGFVAGRADQAVLEKARRAHLAYFARWAHKLKDALRADRERTWIEYARAERTNLYAAADFAISGDPGCDPTLLEALAVLEALGEFDQRTGPLGGFVERVDRAVEAARSRDKQARDDQAVLLRAVYLRAQTLLWTGQYEGAERDYRHAYDVAEQIGDASMAAYSLSGLGFAMATRGREVNGLPMVRQAARQVRDDTGFEVIGVLTNAAIVARNRNEFDEATEYLHRALVHARRRRNAFSQASVLFLLGSNLRYGGQLDEAIRAQSEAHELFSSIGDRRGLLVTYHELGECYFAGERIEDAERCYRDATALASDIGDREYSALFWFARGRSRFWRRDFARAESDLLEATIAIEEVDNIHLKLAALLYLAATYAALERAAEAHNYFGRAARIFEQTDVTREKPLYEILRGYLDAADALEAMRAHQPDPQAARRARSLVSRAYARAQLDQSAQNAPVPGYALKEARRLRAYLDERVAASELPAEPSAGRNALRVCEEMRWFAVDGGDPVDISRRGPIRRILRALVDRRFMACGEPMSAVEVVEAGWPEAVLTAESGAQRTYVTISRMRAMGLKGVLETVDDGYLINPAYTPVWVERQ
jgi:tetratricopeptide (TPR) repeat protein